MRKLLVRCVSSVNCICTLHAIPNSLLTVTEFRLCVLPPFFLLDQAQMHSKVKTSCIRWCRQRINNIILDDKNVRIFFCSQCCLEQGHQFISFCPTAEVQKLKDSKTQRLKDSLNLREYHPGYFHQGCCSLIWYVVVGIRAQFIQTYLVFSVTSDITF